MLFEQPSDYRCVRARAHASAATISPSECLAYCAMPNHWHLIVWPTSPGQLCRFHALARRARTPNGGTRTVGTSGTGAVYQGRYKAIPDRIRPLTSFAYAATSSEIRCEPASWRRAEDWRWSSLWRRCHFCERRHRTRWPVDRPVQLDRVCERAAQPKPNSTRCGGRFGGVRRLEVQSGASRQRDY